MKGLLIKDLYMIRKYCRMLVLMIVVFLGVSVVEEGAIFTVYPVVLAGLVPSTLIAYEERSRWDVYCNVLPVTKTQIVIEKYIVSFGGIMFAIILSCITHGVKLSMAGGLTAAAVLSHFATMFSVSLIGPVVVLPFIFAIGLEKGRIVYYITVGVVCAIAVMFTTIPIPQITVLPAVVVIIDIAVIAASAFISTKLYARREIS